MTGFEQCRNRNLTLNMYWQVPAKVLKHKVKYKWVKPEF